MQLKSIAYGKTSDGVRQAKNWILSAVLAVSFLGCLTGMFQICSEEGQMFAGGVFSGMIRAWNMIADTLGRTQYVLLPKYAGAGGGTGIFFLCAAVALCLLSYAALRSAQAWILLFFAVPYFAGQVVWGLKPPLIWAVCFLCALSLSVLSCVQAESGNLSSVVIVLSVIAAAFAVTYLTAGESWQRPDAAAKLNAAAESRIQSLRYGENPRGDGSLTPREPGEGTALTVTMEDPRPLYLRGFVGSVYKNGRWTTLNARDYYGEADLYYWLRRNGFQGLTQLADGAKLSGKTEQDRVTVQNTGACARYLYLPYETASFDRRGTVDWNSSFVTAKGLRGTAEYTFETAPAMVQDWPELAAQMYLQRENPGYADYYLNESYYNVDNYTFYAQLTDAQQSMIQDVLGVLGERTKEHSDYKEAIRNIRAFLEGECVYTENVKASSDPAGQFLREKKGSDVHFASAATLMFRYYGIPARYVEGYLVTPQDVRKKSADGEISVPRKNNHAWTEIYIDGFGWVPLEATPQYYDVMPQPDLTKGLENISTGHTPLPDAQRDKNSSLEETRTVNRDEERQIPWKLIFFLILLAAAALALIRLLRRRIAVWAGALRRRRAFYGSDVRKAVCAIYESMRDMSVPPGREVCRIGDLAAFSLHTVREEDRRYMLEELQKMRREQRESKKRDRRGAGRLSRAAAGRMRG